MVQQRVSWVRRATTSDCTSFHPGYTRYEAARRYDKGAHDFAESGKVAPAARAAMPGTAADAQQMAEAEAKGRARSKGEDPALKKGGAHKSA